MNVNYVHTSLSLPCHYHFVQCGFFKRKRTWTPEEDHLTEQPDGQGEGQPDGQGEGQVDGEGEEPVVAGAADTRDNKEVEHV